ncbi:MAG: hypothetical protein ACMXYC_00140 [Candidatus Woesearchaeota archaeon]
MHRILKLGGIATIALPKSLINNDEVQALQEVWKHLGFSPLPFSGFYQGEEDTKFQSYVAVVRKTGDASTKPLPKSLLTWEMDRPKKTKKSGRSRKDGMLKEKPVSNPIVVSNFTNTTLKKSLNEIVDEWIN